MLGKVYPPQSVQSQTSHIFLSTASTSVYPNFSLIRSISCSFFQSSLPPLPSAGLPAVLLIHQSLSQM